MKIVLQARGDFKEWRNAARTMLRHAMTPKDIDWTVEGTQTGLFGSGALSDQAPELPRPAASTDITVPPAFINLAEQLICHSDPARFDLAYRLLWRLQTEKNLLEIASDTDVSRAGKMVKSVRRDMHKMTAFVSFKEVLVKEDSATADRRAFIAWFEPDHYIVARTAPFFRRRFGDMDWIIATPKGTAMWDGDALRVDDQPAVKPDLHDDTDALWQIYFANIFNPARLKVKMMQSEMPKKYWKNLPEAELIPELIASAESRVRQMAERQASETAPKFHDRLRLRRD